MHRTDGHANRPPVILKEVQRRRNPEIGETEIFFCLKIECRSVGELLNGPDARRHCLIDFAMIDRMVAEFRRWPGKDEQVVSFASFHLSESAITASSRPSPNPVHSLNRCCRCDSLKLHSSAKS
jgi:hypothetical protein